MRILVTGASGFLGRSFILHATAAGHTITAVSRQICPTMMAKVTTCQAERLFNVPLSTLENIDCLVHFAAAGVSPQKASTSTLFQVNVHDSVVLWEKAAASGVSRFILCGSCFEYGRSAIEFEKIPPSAPLHPITSYGASKASATLAAKAFCNERNVQVSILRPFNVFGEGQHAANLWPSLKAAAESGEDFELSPGEQVRDFVHVNDVATAFLAECNEERSPGITTIRNIGSGTPLTVREFCAYWWKQWGAKGSLKIGALPYRRDEIMRYVPDLS